VKRSAFLKSALAAAALSAAGAMPGMAVAQDTFPSRPITIVVPFGPGSGTDVGTRLLGQKLAELTGQSVIVDNRPGANGAIAAEFVARARPDGYTLLMGTNSTHGANPVLLKELRYDPLRDFTPITRVGVFTSVVVVHPSVPVRTMRELIAYGKTHELSLATGNASGIVMGETLARQVGWKLLRVPFKSNPNAMTEVVAGRVQLMFVDIASGMGQLRAGTLRPLAVTTLTRSSALPELPTLAESGVPDYDLSGWIGLFAPAGAPRAVVDKLNADVTRALQHPDVRNKLAELGAEASPMSVAEYTPWVAREVTKWTTLAREAGIQPQ
jgi:tripartite-type tricarboxylate transporter receptor subunit TctC